LRRQAAKSRDGFAGFGKQRIGMDLLIRPVGAGVGDATNALGGVGDSLQSRRVNIDLSYLGELADVFLFDDDAQIREVRYHEEPGELGYRLRFWALEEHASDLSDPTAWLGDPIVSHDTASGSVYINVPPAARDVVVISVLDAPSPYAEPTSAQAAEEHSGYVKVNLEGAVNLGRGLAAAIAQLQEHDDSPE
jgi:hypothetical protein